MLCVSSAPSMTPAFIRRSIEWHPPYCLCSATIAGLRGKPLPCSPQRLEIVIPQEGGKSTDTPYKPLAGHSFLQRLHVVARLSMLLHGSHGCRLVSKNILPRDCGFRHALQGITTSSDECVVSFKQHATYPSFPLPLGVMQSMHHAAPGMTIVAITVVAATHDPASTHTQGFAMTVLSGVAIETPIENVFI